MDEKKTFSVDGELASPTASISAGSTKDEALVYLEQHKLAANSEFWHDGAYTKALRKKVDRHVIPFFFFCYVLNFLDKILLNYAQVMGITPALKLTGNDYSNASSAFYYPVLAVSALSAYPLQKFPTGKWLAGCLMTWGIITACHSAVQSYHGLLAVRILSGVFEAGIPPSLMLLSSQYYTRSEQATRFGLWYMGIGGGQILGGLVSYLFQFISPHAPLAGWRVMFLVLGLVSVVLGCIMLFFVPDSPMKAGFLSEEEKITLLEHVKRNQTGIENPHFHPKQILEALLGVQYWGTALIVILQTISSGVTSTYSASLIKGFGYSPKQAALLGMPSGAITIISCLFCGFTGERFGHRWFITILVTIPSVLGAALMSWLPKSQKGGLLAGVYLVNFVVGSTPLMYQWLVGNTAGHTKRAFTTGSLNAAFAIGSIIGPQTFQARDSPGYQPAKITLVVSFSVSAVVATLLLLYYFMINKRRAGEALAESDAADVDDRKAYAGLTDKENRSFKYTY